LIGGWRQQLDQPGNNYNWGGKIHHIFALVRKHDELLEKCPKRYVIVQQGFRMIENFTGIIETRRGKTALKMPRYVRKKGEGEQNHFAI
jgi:hypothetical protein